VLGGILHKKEGGGVYVCLSPGFALLPVDYQLQTLLEEWIHIRQFERIGERLFDGDLLRCEIAAKEMQQPLAEPLGFSHHLCLRLEQERVRLQGLLEQASSDGGM